jgi:HK97 family phage prohead protease
MTTTASPRIAMLERSGREFRCFTTRLEARDINGLEFKVSGWASVVEQPYDMGAYTEVISRGAFTKTLQGRPDVQLLTNHEGLPMARTTVPPGQDGHLELSEDGRGLRFDAQLDRDDPDAQTLMRKIGAWLMDQASFAFRVIRQNWNASHTERTIQEVSLDRGDVSVVNFGASPTTSVDARSSRNGRAEVAARDRRLRLANEAGRGNLSLYQARARATALRGRGHLSDNPNLAYYQAQAWALGCRDGPR